MGIKSIMLALFILPTTAGFQAQNAAKPSELPIPSKWTLVVGEFQGDKFKDDTEFELRADGTGRLVFAGDDFGLKYELLPKSDPARIDLALTWVGHRNVPPVPHAGIYRYDGTTLTLCLAWTDKAERPTEFRTATDDGRLLLVLRQKK